MALGERSFDLDAGESTTIYFTGYPFYDGIRVDVDDSSGSSDATVEIATYSDNDPREADENDDWGEMDVVDSNENEDVSDGATYGTAAVSRVVAVDITENDDSDGLEGTISLHRADDTAQTVDAFLER